MTGSVISQFPSFIPQDIESENVNVVKRLFQIQNVNASTVRTVMVAHSRRHDNPDLLLDYEAQSLARAQSRARAPRSGPHQTLHFDLGGTDSEEDGSGEEEEEEEEERLRRQGPATPRLPQPTSSGLEVLQVGHKWSHRTDVIITQLLQHRVLGYRVPYGRVRGLVLSK